MITDSVSTEQLQEQLERLEEKLDRVLQYTQNLESRMEGLSEFRGDFVPIVNDAAKLASAKLLQLEASGVLSAASGIGRALARPELMAALQRSLEVLSVAQDGADNAPGILKAVRDPEVRRGMAVLLQVLRALGTARPDSPEPFLALAAESADS